MVSSHDGLSYAAIRYSKIVNKSKLQIWRVVRLAPIGAPNHSQIVGVRICGHGSHFFQIFCDAHAWERLFDFWSAVSKSVQIPMHVTKKFEHFSLGVFFFLHSNGKSFCVCLCVCVCVCAFSFVVKAWPLRRNRWRELKFWYWRHFERFVLVCLCVFK